MGFVGASLGRVRHFISTTSTLTGALDPSGESFVHIAIPVLWVDLSLIRERSSLRITLGLRLP